MSTEKVSEQSKEKISSRGGYRPGSGRPKGSGNKLTVDKLLASLDSKLGRPYEEQIAENYVKALTDPKLAFQYDQALMNKAMADRHQVEVDETTSVDNRQASFLKALEVMGGVMLDQDPPQDDK